MTKKRQQKVGAETKEKIFLVVFLIFAIAIVILLFKTPTGSTLLSAQLDRTALDPGDDILGTVSLQLQEGDLLPETTTIKLFIRANASECPLNYVCPNDRTVAWYEIDEMGECVLVEPDPEGACCRAFSSDCYQRIVNSGFDDELKFWRLKVYGLESHPEPFGIDYLDDYIEEEYAFSPDAAFLDTGGTRLEDSSVSLYQQLGSKRKIKVSQLKCVENWQCTYSPCLPCNPWDTKGKRTKTCIDLNNCSAPYSETEICSCLMPGDETETEQDIFTDSYKGNDNTFSPELHYENSDGLLLFASPSSKSLRYMFYYETEDVGCAFEVIVKGKSTAGATRNLHFYYKLNDKCAQPGSTATDKYIAMPTPGRGPYIVHDIGIDLYSNWTSAPVSWSEDDTIEEIWLVGHGDKDGYGIYSQFILWDNIKLIKYGAPALSGNCTDRSTRKSPKVCCRKGTGIGSYYGEQLNCSAGYDCWSDCADSLEYELEDFASRKYTQGKGKYNKTGEGFATAVVDGAEIDLETWIDEGDGYSMCQDTTVSRGKERCKGWDNIYKSTIQDLASRTKPFEAPDQAGVYEFIFRVEHLPEGWPPECLPEEEEWGYCGPIIIDERSILFSVSGEVPPGPVLDPCKWINTSNWSAWSDCDEQGIRTRTRNCTYAPDSPRPCDESNKANCITDTWADPACITLPPCLEDDYDIYDWCDDWAPTPCGPGETQTRTCTADLSICNDTAPGAEPPVEAQDCSISVITEYVSEQRTAGRERDDVQNELKRLGWKSPEIKMVLNSVYGEEERGKGWIWIVIILLLVAAAAVVLMLRMKKPKAKKAAVPPELLSYIKDAITSGATKSEIAARLVGAGWPRESVDAALKTIK